MALKLSAALVCPPHQDRASRSMPLKTRLLALFALFLTLAALGGATVLVLNARGAVQAEMVSALELAAALARQSEDFGAERLNDLGLRHIRARGDDDDRPAAPPRRQSEDAPDWFTALIGVAPIELRITRSGGGPAVVLSAEPHDEVAEVWNDMVDLALVALALSAAMTAALAAAVDRALRPLTDFERGLNRLAAGDYAFRPGVGGPPELARLGARIAGLADALAAAQRENRRLGARLVAAQDDERRQLARDLHDELGATLFGMKVDAGRIAGQSADRPDIADCARRVLAAADHLNQLGRSVMTRLRPPLLDQLTLSEALTELVDSGRRRQPELRWRLDLQGPLDELPDSAALTVYRLVQEGLTNARRHGAPQEIAVSVTVDSAAGTATVQVSDDGRGLAPDAAAGAGLAGLTERVQVLGGKLEIAAGAEGGAVLTAALPFPFAIKEDA
jgi:two-component system, NarL family, sensor histidine kinase UhpB